MLHHDPEGQNVGRGAPRGGSITTPCSPYARQAHTYVCVRVYTHTIGSARYRHAPSSSYDSKDAQPMGAPRRMCGDGRNAGTSGCGRAPAKSSKDGCPPHVQPRMVVAQQSCPRHRHSSNPRVLWSQNCNTPTPVAATDKATAPRAAQAGTHATTTTAVQRIHAHRQAASTTTITTSPPAQRQCSLCPDAKRFSMASAHSERPAMSQPQSSPALVDIQLLYVHTPRSYRAVDCTDDVEILSHHCGTTTSYACFAVGAQVTPGLRTNSCACTLTDTSGCGVRLLQAKDSWVGSAGTAWPAAL